MGRETVGTTGKTDAERLGRIDRDLFGGDGVDGERRSQCCSVGKRGRSPIVDRQTGLDPRQFISVFIARPLLLRGRGLRPFDRGRASRSTSRRDRGMAVFDRPGAAGASARLLGAGRVDHHVAIGEQLQRAGMPTVAATTSWQWAANCSTPVRRIGLEEETKRDTAPIPRHRDRRARRGEGASPPTDEADRHDFGVGNISSCCEPERPGR